MVRCVESEWLDRVLRERGCGWPNGRLAWREALLAAKAAVVLAESLRAAQGRAFRPPFDPPDLGTFQAPKNPGQGRGCETTEPRWWFL